MSYVILGQNSTNPYSHLNPNNTKKHTNNDNGDNNNNEKENGNNRINNNTNGSIQISRQQNQDLRNDRKAIESFVTRHYDTESRMLNLSSLSSFLPKTKIIDFNSKRFALLLESILAVSCTDVISLALDKNNISKLGPVSYILHHRLKLQNLSLDSNSISNFNELKELQKVDLRELNLTNNPISNEIQDETTYKMEVVRRLPNLYMLNSQPIKEEDNHKIVTLPLFRESYFDNEDLKTIAKDFIQIYYSAFDGDRDSLVKAYSENCCFSVSLPAQKRRTNSCFVPDRLSSYSNVDRNLNNTQSIEKRASTLKTGPTHIVGTLLDLPQTTHDYESFVVDCFVSDFGGTSILNIFVHGSFTETSGSKKKRSFSRVFLLSPSSDNIKHEGWPIVIINDQFHIRHYTAKKQKPPQPQIPEIEPVMGETPLDKEELVRQFATASKLKMEIAKECLEKNDWKFEIALFDFNDLMAQGRINSSWLQ